MLFEISDHVRYHPLLLEVTETEAQVQVFSTFLVVEMKMMTLSGKLELFAMKSLITLQIPSTQLAQEAMVEAVLIFCHRREMRVELRHQNQIMIHVHP